MVTCCVTVILYDSIVCSVISPVHAVVGPEDRKIRLVSRRRDSASSIVQEFIDIMRSLCSSAPLHVHTVVDCDNDQQRTEASHRLLVASRDVDYVVVVLVVKVGNNTLVSYDAAFASARP